MLRRTCATGWTRSIAPNRAVCSRPSSRAFARARGHRTSCADAAARSASRITRHIVGRDGPAGRSGSLPLEPDANRRRGDSRRAGARLASIRSIHAAGGNRGRPRRGAGRTLDRLAANRRAVRRASEDGPIPGYRAQPSRCRRNERRSRSRTRAHRHNPGPRRSHRLSPRARCAWRSLPAARTHRGSDAQVCERARACDTGAGAAVPREAAGGIAGYFTSMIRDATAMG